jgi:NADPH:quinone reductase-like Zn-dependent oxidoreductase
VRQDVPVRVVEVTDFGGPDVLRPAERPDPVPGPGEVVVRIGAATVNPTDLGARAGAHRARMPDLTPPFVPGWDLAGELPGGERVVGMIPWTRVGGRVGVYAEAAAVDPDWLAPIGDTVEDAVAATLPLNALTARQALELLGAPPGATILITGAAGAVGGYATQLAVRAGYRVIAVAGRDDEEWVQSFGPAEVLPRDADLSRADVDAVLDAVPVGAQVAGALRSGGTVVFTRPPRVDPPPGVRFETILVRSDPAALRELAADLEAGRLRTRVAERLPLAEAAHAHALAEAGGTAGKVVLIP